MTTSPNCTASRGRFDGTELVPDSGLAYGNIRTSACPRTHRNAEMAVNIVRDECIALLSPIAYLAVSAMRASLRQANSADLLTCVPEDIKRGS